MTFLQLAQRACIECGVASNTAITTALPTVIGATGSVGRVVNWVADALSDILMDCDEWEFMRSSNILGAGVSFATVAGQASYPLGTGPGTVGVAVDDLGHWCEGTFRNFTTTVGFRNEVFMDNIGFDVWRDGFMYGAMRSVQTRPVAIAIGPDKSLNLGPPPDGQYTVTGDFWIAPTNLVNDADIPAGLPTRFHMLIVYRAMCKYAGYESAPEVYQRGKEEGDGMFAQLEAIYAPRIGWGGSLA